MRSLRQGLFFGWAIALAGPAPLGHAQAAECPASPAEFSGRSIKAQTTADTRGGVLAALRAANEVFKNCKELRQKISDDLMALARTGPEKEKEAALYTLGNLQLAWRSTNFDADKQHLYGQVARHRGPNARLAALYDKALMNGAGLYLEAAREFEKRFNGESAATVERALAAVAERYPESSFNDESAFLLASVNLRAAIDATRGGEQAAARPKLAAAIKHYQAIAADYEAFLKTPAAKTRFAHPSPMAMPALYHLALAHALNGEEEKSAQALKRIAAIYEQSLGESRRIVFGYSLYFYRILWLDQPQGSPAPLNANANLKFIAERTQAAVAKWDGKLGSYANIQQFARELEDEARKSRDFGIALGQFESREKAKAFADGFAPKLAAARSGRPALAGLGLAIFQPIGETKSFTVVLRPLAARDEALRLLEALREIAPAGAAVMRIL